MTDARTRTLIDDLRAVVAEAEALLASGASDASAHAAGIRERASEAVEKARARLDSLEADVRARANDATAEAAAYVRDNPWQSLGIAAAAGVVIGLLLSRR